MAAANRVGCFAPLGRAASICVVALAASCGGGDTPTSNTKSATSVAPASIIVPATGTQAPRVAAQPAQRMRPLMALAPVSVAPAIAAGDYHSMALKSDGTVWTWGWSYGALDITSDASRYVPTQVVGPGGIGALTGVAAIAASGLHSVALKSDGTVWAWGNDVSSQPVDNVLAPVQVVGPGGIGTLTDMTAVAAGGYHSMALKSDGTVWTWGWNSYGQLGNNGAVMRYPPVQVAGPGGIGVLSGVVAIKAGYFHSMALKSDGTVWAWGYGFDGQLGNNRSNVNSGSPVPTQVMGPGGTGALTGVIAIASGAFHSIALKNDGTVWAWGMNISGQLGNNSTTNSSTPVQVLGLGGTGLLAGVSAIQSGTYHSLALRVDGTVLAWGFNALGSLGNCSTIDSSVPALVVGPNCQGLLSSVTAITGGAHQSLAFKSDGTVWAWGWDSYGQLGNPLQIGMTQSPSPVQVIGPGGVGFLNLGAALPQPSAHLRTVALSNAIGVSISDQRLMANGPITVETEIRQGDQSVSVLRSILDPGGTLQQVLDGLQNGTPATVSTYAVDAAGNRSDSLGSVYATPQPAPDSASTFASSKQPVLLLHGFDSNKGTWKITEKVLRDAGLKVDARSLNAGSDNPCQQAFGLGLDVNGNPIPSLSSWISDVKRETGATRVILVGHSQGGIVGRLYLQAGANPTAFADELGKVAELTGYEDQTKACVSNLADNAVFQLDQVPIAGLITYGTPHRGAGSVGSISPLLGVDAQGGPRPFLKVLNRFSKFPIPDGVLLTSLIGKTSATSSDDCLVDTASQDMSLVLGAPPMLNFLPVPWRRHAGLSLAFTCPRGAPFRLPETQDWASILGALKAQILKINIKSPVDIVVTSPSGKVIQKGDSAIWGATYDEFLDETGDKKKVVTVPFPERGAYQIRVVPDPAASPTATFTIETELDGVTTTLVDGASIADALSQPMLVIQRVDNLAPTSNAGMDRTVRRGSLVTLDGSSSIDPDNSPAALSFTWAQIGGASVSLSGRGTAKPTFIPVAAGRYTFRLAVNDGATTNDLSTVTITAPVLGDINGDGTVDSLDLARVNAALNTQASGPNDLRDLDGDGRITALDARKLVTLCTRPRCTTR